MAEKGKKNKTMQPKKPVQKLKGNSYNPQQELLELLKTKCPEVFTEGKIDAAKLKQTLGEELDTNNERYGLTWAGKAECFRHIQEATTATLKPDRKESVDFETSENIFIEGDNLEVLKVLQKNYSGKVKMIYIDPPYNTGNDSFIYPDRFKEEKADYEERAGIKDAEGLLTKDGFFRKNSKDTGHFHSNWLCMMYPRLFLARNLLREDGFIFVSIDDNEVHNLRMIMDEIFGENNFIERIVWKKRYGAGGGTKGFAKLHEYILVYGKNPIENIEAPLTKEQIGDYESRDEKYNQRGGYVTQPLATSSKGVRSNLMYKITHEDKEIEPKPGSRWLWSKEKFEEAYANNQIVINETGKGFSVRFKQYLKDQNGNIRNGKPLSIKLDVL